MLVRKRVVIAFLGAATVLLAGCTSTAPGQGEPVNFEDKAIRTAPDAGHSDDWVMWDTAGCKYVPSNDHPDSWRAALRKPLGEFTVGFGAQDMTNEVNITMNKSMEKSAADADVDLAIADYKFPSTSEPVSAARSIVAREPAVVVSDNQLDDLLASVNSLFADACLPVVQVVTAAEGTVLFGPSNDGMGQLQGERLLDYAESKGWSADNTTLMTTFYSPAGPEVAKRASVCADTVKKGLPGVKSVEHDTKTTTSLELQNNFSDLLSANPEAENILVCTVADLWALADANALRLANRHETAAVTGVNGGVAVLDAIKQGKTALVGTVDLGADAWGDYWIPLAADIASGKPVPAEVYAPIKMLPEALPQ